MGNYLEVLLTFVFIITMSSCSDIHDSSYGNRMKTLGKRFEKESNLVSTLHHYKPVFEAIEDLDKRSLLRKANNYLSENQTNSYDVSDRCLNDTKMFIAGILQRQPWAIKMFDAMGKLPTDIMSGNLAWVGSYDECRSVQALMTNNVNQTGTTSQYSQFEGKYCQLEFAIPNPAKYMFNPSAYALLTIGMCFPDSCSDSDTLALTNIAFSFIRLHNMTIPAIRSNCQENNLEYDTSAIAVLVICGVYMVLLLLATLYDVVVIELPKQRKDQQQKVYVNEPNGVIENGVFEAGEHKPLLEHDLTKTKEFSDNEPGMFGKTMIAFSLYSNCKKLLSTNQPPGSLTCIHGIRFFSMTWVLLCHTYLESIGSAANIATYLQSLADRWTFQAICNAFVSVDSFFALSGLLMAYLVLKELKKNDGKLNWPMFYFHRFWRLTPPYMLFMMVYTALYPYISDGPSYHQNGIDQCKDYWWTNLLYINNFVQSEKCMGWTWYLANDMQFFIVSPLLILTLYFLNTIGVIINVVFLIGLMITTGVVSSVNNLPPSPFGGGGANADTTAYNDDYYIKPHTRMAPYVVGILVGYILYKTECRFKLNKILNLIGWIIAAAMACAVLYGLYDPLNGRNMLSTDVSALYNATHKVVWAACVCWVIYACVTGNGGYIDTFLSWKGFVPLSRLTYCTYLVHLVVLSVYVDSLRQRVVYTDLILVWTILGTLVVTYGVAFALSLAFESPMMGLEKVIFKRGDRKSS